MLAKVQRVELLGQQSAHCNLLEAPTPSCPATGPGNSVCTSPAAVASYYKASLPAARSCCIDPRLGAQRGQRHTRVCLCSPRSSWRDILLKPRQGKPYTRALKVARSSGSPNLPACDRKGSTMSPTTTAATMRTRHASKAVCSRPVGADTTPMTWRHLCTTGAYKCLSQCTPAAWQRPGVAQWYLVDGFSYILAVHEDMQVRDDAVARSAASILH